MASCGLTFQKAAHRQRETELWRLLRKWPAVVIFKLILLINFVAIEILTLLVMVTSKVFKRANCIQLRFNKWVAATRATKVVLVTVSLTYV